MKVLVAESVDINVLEEFRKKTDIQIDYEPDITTEELVSKIKGYSGLIVRPKLVPAAVINNSDKLKIIIRGGAGVNSIDLAAAKAKGIIVENTPGLNSDATAEFSILLMLQCFAKRQMEISSSQSRSNTQTPPENYMGFELKGKKLGLVGLGNIGQRVAKIAEGFGMEVIAYTRSKKRSSIQQIHDLHEFLKHKFDILSLHIPLSADSNGIIGDEEFALMKNGTVIINTARPQLIDATAFGKALASGKVASAGIDGDYDVIEPFIKADVQNKCIITHHIADSTYEAQANITQTTLIQMLAYLEQNHEINRVI